MKNFATQNNNNMKKFKKTITVYNLGQGFFVEVYKGAEETKFYIYNENYGIKSLMFGLPSRDIHSVETLILSNAEKQIRIYSEMYMDEHNEEDLDI